MEDSSTAVKNVEGQVVSAVEQVDAVWREHYCKILFDEAHLDLYPAPPVHRSDIDIVHTLINEVSRGIKSLTDGKTPGVNGVVSELLKACGAAVVFWLINIMYAVFDGSHLLEYWKTSEICPIHKKEDVMEPGNNRPIGLLPHSYKVIADVIRRRSMVRMEEVVSV